MGNSKALLFFSFIVSLQWGSIQSQSLLGFPLAFVGGNYFDEELSQLQLSGILMNAHSQRRVGNVSLLPESINSLLTSCSVTPSGKVFLASLQKSIQVLEFTLLGPVEDNVIISPISAALVDATSDGSTLLIADGIYNGGAVLQSSISMEFTILSENVNCSAASLCGDGTALLACQDESNHGFFKVSQFAISGVNATLVSSITVNYEPLQLSCSPELGFIASLSISGYIIAYPNPLNATAISITPLTPGMPNSFDFDVESGTVLVSVGTFSSGLAGAGGDNVEVDVVEYDESSGFASEPLPSSFVMATSSSYGKK